MILGFMSNQEHGEQRTDAAAECGENDERFFGDTANRAAWQFADRLVINYDDGGYDA